MIHYITTNGIGNAWVANELRQVERAGIPVVLHAMRKVERTFHLASWAERMHSETVSIYPLRTSAMIVDLLLAPFRFRARFFQALTNALFGERESLRARLAGIAHLAVACTWAARLRQQPPAHIHSQWIHSCGTIGMYAAELLGTSFSFTGHAADLFRDRCALRDKIRRADFIICISSFHRDFYLREGARPEQLRVVYCGIDVEQFAPSSDVRRDRGVLRIRSSGRLVEKKGFVRLIEACRILADRGVEFECVIAGDGPLESRLRGEIERLGLQARVILTGETLKQEKIPEFMHGGDIYCLPCVWASDGDVDGLPQMLMEAMACGLPVISTRLVGIPDLVMHEDTGLLVEPNDAAGIADAVIRLSRDPTLANRLADAGRRHVISRFNLSDCLEPLMAAYRSKLGAGCPADAAGRGAPTAAVEGGT